MLSGSRVLDLPRPFLGIFGPMCFHSSRNLGISPPGMLSATGTRGSLTIPHSMASISEKSLIVQGKQGALGIARAAQEKGGGRQVNDLV